MTKSKAMDIEAREEEIVRVVPPDLANELQHAPLGNLRGYVMSQQAVALAAHLAQKYPRVPRTAGRTKRTNRVGKRADDFERAIAAFVADLLTAQSARDASGWLRLSLNKESFTGQPVKQRVFEGVRTAWRNAGLIEEQLGYPGSLGFGRPGPTRGRMSRFRATPALLGTCEDYGITPANLMEHFALQFEMPNEVLQLTQPSILTPDTPAARALRSEVAALNASFAMHSLDGATHIGWVRKFHMYSRPYAWNKGGRLYSQPSVNNYQQMPQERRLELRLDGREVAEIDISASFLTIFYAWHGQSFNPLTAYTDLIGPDEYHRAVVKTWVNASFGNSGLITRWLPSLKKDFEKRYKQQGWTIDGRQYPVSLVKQATLARHPLLNEWGKSSKGKPRDWGDLMYRESQIIISTMRRLATDHDIPSLPVHDSLIVPLSQVQISREVLEEQFRVHTGVVPVVKVRRSTAFDF